LQPAAPAAPEARLQQLLNDKSCRACTSTRDLFAAFGSHLRHAGGAAGPAAGASASTGPGSPPSSPPSSEAASEKPPFWFYEEEMPDPPDVVDIGRATWTLLHTMAAYYPDSPTPQQQASMRGFVAALGDHYPCHECRAHLREDLARDPPDTAGAAALSEWACRLHNRVNVMLGKPEFDCGLALQRWRDGPPGAGDEVYGLAAHNREVDAQQQAAEAAPAGGSAAGGAASGAASGAAPGGVADATRGGADAGGAPEGGAAAGGADAAAAGAAAALGTAAAMAGQPPQGQADADGHQGREGGGR
jgi:hypothetical protein